MKLSYFRILQHLVQSIQSIRPLAIRRAVQFLVQLAQDARRREFGANHQKSFGTVNHNKAPQTIPSAVAHQCRRNASLKPVPASLRSCESHFTLLPINVPITKRDCSNARFGASSVEPTISITTLNASFARPPKSAARALFAM